MVNEQYQKLIAKYDLHCLYVKKATQVKLGESNDEKNKRIALLESEYVKWFEYYFPHYAKVKCATFHKKLADEIIGNRKIRMLAEIYRSGAKSVHVCMGIPLFLSLVEKDLNFMLLIGETDIKAKVLLSDVQSELQYNERIKNDYGNKYKKGDWSDGSFFTSDGIRFHSLGFDQSARGFREGANRPDYIAVDDVDTKRHINNNKIMGDSVDKITEDIMGCFDATDGGAERFVYSNNNFHKNSITNRLKFEFKNSRTKDEENKIKSDYVILTVTAVKDLKRFIPTWPEKTSSEYWRRKYNNKPKSFLREYMHIHVQDGKIFKAEFFQWKKMLPLHKYDALVMYGDLSYKDQGDFKAMILMGKIKREYHFIHVFCRKVSRKAVAEWAYNLYEDHKLHDFNIKWKIEGLFAMDDFISEFDNEGDERGYHIPVIADKRGKANKYDRIESTESYFERRWCYFNEDEKESADQIEMVDQYLAFEKGSAINDDAPDCGHGCIDELNRATFSESFEPRINQRTSGNSEFDY